MQDEDGWIGLLRRAQAQIEGRMSDAGAEFETRTGRIYQAYGLNGRYSEDFELDRIARLFKSKYGHSPKEVMVTAGGGTCLAGPIRKRMS